MIKAETYTVEAKKAGAIELPADVFALPWNAALMHQVVVSMQANMRTPVAHTKSRGDVRGGGRKPWRQKGTGQARHGSIRSPLWKGGGVTFGPRNEKDFSKSINKKMRAKALFVALSKKLKDGHILFVESMVFGKPSTAEAKKVITLLSTVKGFEGMNTKRRNSVLLVTAGNEPALVKSFNNFGNVEVDTVRNLNPVDVLKYKYLLVVSPKESVRILEEREKKVLGSKKSVSDTRDEKKTKKKTGVKKAAKKTVAKK